LYSCIALSVKNEHKLTSFFAEYKDHTMYTKSNVVNFNDANAFHCKLTTVARRNEKFVRNFMRRHFMAWLKGDYENVSQMNINNVLLLSYHVVMHLLLITIWQYMYTSTSKKITRWWNLFYTYAWIVVDVDSSEDCRCVDERQGRRTQVQ